MHTSSQSCIQREWRDGGVVNLNIVEIDTDAEMNEKESMLTAS